MPGAAESPPVQTLDWTVRGSSQEASPHDL